jgi:ankyrin repeat protein
MESSMKSLRTLILAGALFASASLLPAQNLKEDIQQNELTGLENKVALLEPDFKKFPYLAYYLEKADEYQQRMFDYLVAHGADVNQVDDSGLGPLYYAIKASNLQAVNALIARKANVNAAWISLDFYMAPEVLTYHGKDIKFDRPGTTEQDRKSGVVKIRPLWVALSASDPDIIAALLAAGADPLAETWHLKDEKASTPKKTIYITNTVFDYVVGRFALTNNSDDRVNPEFFANANLIWQAVKSLPVDAQPKLEPELNANLYALFCQGNIKAFRTELVKTESNTLNFLPYAALAENWDIIDLILKYNQLDVNDKISGNNSNLLDWAIEGLHTGATSLLLNHGADLSLIKEIETKYRNIDRDFVGSPLAWAVANGKAELAAVLVSHGAAVNSPDVPLSYAHANPSIRKFLIDSGADCSVVLEKEFYDSTYKLTLLSDAALKGYPEAVGFYLEKGLDPNEKNSDIPPLVSAVSAGQVESVNLLLAHGADPRIIVTSSMQRSLKRMYDRDNASLAEWALDLTDKSDSPLYKARYSAIAKALAKAAASLPPLTEDAAGNESIEDN